MVYYIYQGYYEQKIEAQLFCWDNWLFVTSSPLWSCPQERRFLKLIPMKHYERGIRYICYLSIILR